MTLRAALAVIAVAGDEAVRAVEECARKGVKVAVVMTSGFGETGAEGKAAQERMAAAARAAGMRLVGPNCQGLANFASGAVPNFSTIFNEMEARDGPVAIVSQSGACSQAIYILARQRGLDVRHVHATGNEADVTVADLAAEIVQEEGVRLVLLYMEAIQRPAVLAQAAEVARARDLLMLAIPIAGAGYDVPLFARDAAAFRQRYGRSLAAAADALIERAAPAPGT